MYSGVSVCVCNAYVYKNTPRTHNAVCVALQCVAVRCSVLQCVAVRCSVLQCVAVCCSALQCVAVRCSVLQCVAVCCSALQCVPLFCSRAHCNTLQHTANTATHYNILQHTPPVLETGLVKDVYEVATIGRPTPSNQRSLLQKSPVKGTVFCKRAL